MDIFRVKKSGIIAGCASGRYVMTDDGKMVVTTASDRRVFIYDPLTGLWIQEIELKFPPVIVTENQKLALES
ncbi:hypothetical protein A2924_00540 [Candidatus Giovannonibacteria bacterium RIFCSPLOWO2_01_FULL_44_16]|uniref:Uncharacterized protein n=1 Tax=Candidatus Giovannonibacteria bacterium RIFCSPLOWO2_01_FULL_44_16 TaxID=1798348 RepID=A0A1F5X5R1_9BACT|nr:MAG: hypothetical protein A2924_00540 [Candidatus Giovannonibacteria bacterium RIFCSPLOWO2_01_FULL_44_16]